MAKKLVIFHSRNWAVEGFECRFYEDGRQFNRHVTDHARKINEDLLRVYGGPTADCRTYSGEHSDAIQKAYASLRCTDWVEDVSKLYEDAYKELYSLGNNIDISSSIGKAVVAKLNGNEADMVKNLRQFASLFRPTWHKIINHHKEV